MEELSIEEMEEKPIEQIPIQEIMNNIEKDLAKKYEVPRSVIRKRLQLYYTSMRKLSIEEIIKKYENGAKIKDLADECGTTRQNISDRISKYYKKNGKENPRKPKILSEEEIKEVIKEWENEKTVEEIAAKYEVSQTTIYEKIKEYYNQPGRKNPREEKKLNETKEIINQWENGITKKEIAGERGRTAYFVGKKIKSHTDKTGARVVKGTTIIVDYLKKGLTPKQIMEVAKQNSIIIPKNLMQDAIKKVQGTADVIVEEGREIDD